MKRLLTYLLLATATLLISCRENPEEVTLRRRQAQKLVELEDRLSRVRAEMAVPAKENAEDLRKSREAADEAEELVKKREQELAALEAKLDKATQEDAAYRRKYVVDDKKGGKP